jgi:hypothetical protein
LLKIKYKGNVIRKISISKEKTKYNKDIPAAAAA